jgi:hypothetical protein
MACLDEGEERERERERTGGGCVSIKNDEGAEQNNISSTGSGE